MSKLNFKYDYTYDDQRGNERIEKFIYSIKKMYDNGIHNEIIKQKIKNMWTIFNYDYSDVNDTDSRDTFWDNLASICPEFDLYDTWDYYDYKNADKYVKKYIKKKEKIKPKTKKALIASYKWYDNKIFELKDMWYSKNIKIYPAYKELVDRGMFSIPDVIENISQVPSYLCFIVEDIVGDVIKSDNLEGMCKDCIDWYKQVV